MHQLCLQMAYPPACLLVPLGTWMCSLTLPAVGALIILTSSFLPYFCRSLWPGADTGRSDTGRAVLDTRWPVLEGRGYP